jgi:CDP-diacylglycerol--serine O-phosphatidyltransferase
MSDRRTDSDSKSAADADKERRTLRAVNGQDSSGGEATDATDATEEVRQPRRGVYLLPNLITTGALFAGFYAIVAGMNGQLIAAALAIFAAMALDTADGRVARRTHTESQFGAEYDSLSDMVAFGVAPALVAFSWGLGDALGRVGWVATFIYMACAALRLARFNVQSNTNTNSFTGLASPSAAAVIACSVWVWSDTFGSDPSMFAAGCMGVITVVVGLLMVSNFEYYSPKALNMKGRVPFITLVLVTLVFAVLLADPPRVLLFLFTVYALSGPVIYGWRALAKRRAAGEDVP